MEKENQKIGYKDILGQTQYMKMMVANLISRFGDSVDAIAFTWLVYAATGSASWSAIIFGLNMLPSIIIQPFAGALVERMNKKALMVIADFLRGIAVTTLAVCYITGYINPLLLSVFTLFISTVEAFCMPASTALIPKLLDRKLYEFGMSLNTAGSTIFQLIGTAMGGVIIGVWGVGIAIIIDAGTFLISAIIKIMIKVKENEKDHTDSVSSDQNKSYISVLKDGFHYVKTKKIIKNFCLLAMFVNAMLVPINSLQSPLVIDVLGQKSELLSVIGIGVMAGMGIGSFIFPYISGKKNIRKIVVGTGLGFSFLSFGIPMGEYFKDNTALVYLYTGILFILIGICVSVLSTLLNIEFMKNVEEEYLARASAILGSCCLLASPVTSFFISFLVKFIPVKEIYWASAICCAIIFLIVQIRKVALQEEVEEKIDASNRMQGS